MDEYPTHPNTAPERASIALDEFLSAIVSDAIGKAVADIEAQITGTRYAANELSQYIAKVSGETFLPLAEIQNLSVNMDLAQRELAQARTALSDAYRRKTIMEDERKAAEAVVATSEAAKGSNDPERKAKLALALATDGDYRLVSNAARQAVFGHEEAQGVYDTCEKKHQASRAVMELYAGWLRAMAQ
jgi:hypothetical protein